MIQILEEHQGRVWENQTKLCAMVQILEEHQGRVWENQTKKQMAKNELAACQAAIKKVQDAMRTGKAAATLSDRLNMQHMRAHRTA